MRARAPRVSATHRAHRPLLPEGRHRGEPALPAAAAAACGRSPRHPRHVPRPPSLNGALTGLDRGQRASRQRRPPGLCRWLATGLWGEGTPLGRARPGEVRWSPRPHLRALCARKTQSPHESSAKRPWYLYPGELAQAAASGSSFRTLVEIHLSERRGASHVAVEASEVQQGRSRHSESREVRRQESATARAGPHTFALLAAKPSLPADLNRAVAAGRCGILRCARTPQTFAAVK